MAHFHISVYIFDVYSGMDRRARYILEDVPSITELSLEGLIEDGITSERLMRENVPSAEDVYFEREDRRKLTQTMKKISTALSNLPDEDYQLIHAIFFDGISVRE